MKAICKYTVFKLFIYSFNNFNIDAEKPFSGMLNKVYVCMNVCMGWNSECPDSDSAICLTGSLMLPSY